jgi:hypothetical protein
VFLEWQIRLNWVIESARLIWHLVFLFVSSFSPRLFFLSPEIFVIVSMLSIFISRSVLR